jgi:plastocyanin
MRIWSRVGVLIAAFAVVAGGSWLARAAGKQTVQQKNKAFSTTELTVKVGDVLEFKNDDDVAHNVFSTSATQAFNTKIQPPGASAEVTFSTEGVVQVRCAIHPQMKLTVHVEK